MPELSSGKVIRRRRKVVCHVALVGLTLCSYHAVTAQGGSLKDIKSLLTSPNWEERVAAVDTLMSTSTVDTTKAIGVLLEALRSEIATPLSTSMARGAYVTVTEVLKRRYSLGLKSYGQTARDIIYPMVDSTGGEFRARLEIVLGLLGDQRVHDDLRHVYFESDDGFLRLSAIEGLRAYSDTSDIGVFKAALTDSFHVLQYGGYEISEHTLKYPVRSQAAGALLSMGFKLALSGKEYTILAEPK